MQLFSNARTRYYPDLRVPAYVVLTTPAATTWPRECSPFQLRGTFHIAVGSDARDSVVNRSSAAASGKQPCLALFEAQALSAASYLRHGLFGLIRVLRQRFYHFRCHGGKNLPKEQVKPTLCRNRMKTKITTSISPAAIAIALFCAVAVLTPTSTITITKTNDSDADSLRQTPLPRIPGRP